jgi:gamma-glutamyl-gamma-aminobutyrate hydrolase PuuD
VASNGSDRRPRIGVTTYLESARWGVWARRAAVVPQTYVDAVSRAGGVPLLLPPDGDGVGAAVDVLDGVLLIGGVDVDPDGYGAVRHAETRGVQTSRDGYELRLLHTALSSGTPILGVCRGAQLLNVALGGSLHQHLPERLGHKAHLPSPGVFGRTRVRLDAGSSLVGRALGDTAVVSCHHHQGFDRLGAGLVAVAWDDDGLVEAVERSVSGFVVGVQWHPEEDADGGVGLFDAFVRAATTVPARG